MSQVQAAGPEEDQIDRFLKVSTVKSDWTNTDMQRSIALGSMRSWNTRYGPRNAVNDGKGRYSNCASCAAVAISELQRANLHNATPQITGGRLEELAGFHSVILLAWNEKIKRAPTGADVSHAFFKVKGGKDGLIACVNSNCVDKKRKLKRSQLYFKKDYM